MKLATIFTGTKPNDGTGDTMPDAFDKINYNFMMLATRLGIEFEEVVFKDWEDLRPAFETINRNFNKAQQHVNK